MSRNLALAFFLYLAASTGFAQSPLNGKWATDRPDPLTITEAQRKQSAVLEVTIQDAKASGTLTLGGLGGTFYTFKNGKVTGNKVQFQADELSTSPTWTIEMVDDNTVMLSRGHLPLVENNVLDLLATLGTRGRPTPPAQVAPLVQAAAVAGIVQDPTKARVPGATVTATNVDTGLLSTAITNEAGLYGFPNVVPGKYTITVSIPGFKTTTVSNLSVGDTQVLQDFTLELATRASANPSAASCSRNGMVWCTLLHRAK